MGCNSYISGFVPIISYNQSPWTYSFIVAMIEHCLLNYSGFYTHRFVKTTIVERFITWSQDTLKLSPKERIKRGKEMLFQCTDGLAYIHSLKMIHGYFVFFVTFYTFLMRLIDFGRFCCQVSIIIKDWGNYRWRLNRTRTFFANCVRSKLRNIWFLTLQRYKAE